MIRGLSLMLIIAVAAVAVYGAVTLLDESLQVGRMWETPAVRPHEKPILTAVVGSVPFSGGEAFAHTADPQTLAAPLDLEDPTVVAQGSQGYRYYCNQCHGPYHDGLGTVGQSFAPLPGDLRSSRVQAMAPGRMFHEISYGIPDGRQPALATTIAAEERWRIVGYVKSLGVRP